MKKKIIITGNEKIVNTIIHENKIRVSRGDIKFIEFSEYEKQGKRYKKEKSIDTENAVCDS